MHHYTRLTQSEIKDLLAKFNIYNISSISLLEGGSENTNYAISTESEKYVLCICEQKSLIDTKNLAQLLHHLHQNNFTTSQIICDIDNKAVIVYKNKPIMVKQFINGKNVKDLSPHLLQAVGSELAKLHKITPPDFIPVQLSYGIEQFKKVKTYAADSSFDLWLSKIQEYVTPFIASSLPKSLIHSDLFWDNVIVNEAETEVTIMDFEEATYYYRTFDIGMAIIGCCSQENIVDLEKVRYFLKGYRRENAILDLEVNALKAMTIYAGAAMTFWRHQNFNHSKPTPTLFDHYLGLKVLVDDVAKQPEDCFIKLYNN